LRDDKWRTVEAELNEVLGLAPADRAVFLANIEDPEIRVEVISLLAADSGETASNLDSILHEAAEVVFEEPTPRSLSHFRVLRELGRGGMGIVYLARDVNLEREVALKLLPSGAHVDGSRLRRFEREARLAAALNHANIVTIFEVGEWEGRHFIATELVDGKTLAELIQRGPLPQAEAMRVGGQILAALAVAHKAGIVHRDLKPANVMVRADGTVKVLDFGLARLMHDATSAAGIGRRLSVAGEGMGTPGYAAPEQWEGKPADARSDIYSFGRLFYEMLQGVRPLAQRQPLRSRALERIASRCLEYDPERRWHSAADLQRQMEQAHLAPDWLRRAAIGAAAIVLLLGAMFVWRSRTHATTLSDKDVLVLADFTNRTSDPVFDGTLRQALAIQLEQSPFLKIMDDAQMRQDMRLMRRSPSEPITSQLAHDICVRDAAVAMIEGGVASLGKAYAITLQAVNCQNGATLAREQSQASDKEHVLQAVGKAATAMRVRLGESMTSVEKLNRPLEQFTTSSLDALKKYTLGYQLQSQGQFFSAIPYFQQATDLDPNFAWAYGLLSIAYSNAGDRKRLKEYATRAFELSDRASEFERLNIAARYYWQVTGQLDKAIDVYHTAARSYPRDWGGHSELSLVYRDSGEFEKAVEESEKAVILGPKMEPAYRNLVRAYVSLDRFNPAKDVCAKARAQQLNGPRLHFLCLEVAWMAGDQPATEGEIQWFTGKPEEYLSLGLQGVGADVSGKRREASEFYRRAAEAARRRGLPGVAADFDEADALADALSGNCQTKRRLARPALALAMCGDSEGAARLVAITSKELPQGTLWNAVQRPAILAAIELKRNQPANAIRMLASATPYERAFPEVKWLRGQAYSMLGEGGRAVTEIREILDHKGANWSLFYALSHAALARAQALQGDRAASKQAYDRFFALWKDADADSSALRRAREEFAREEK
jgi:eukaryotic-like serine/threonine-protein kinase